MNFEFTKNYQWIVQDKDYLGGKLAIRGSRLSVSLILQCLAEGMTVEEIKGEYPTFPQEALREVLTVAAEMTDEQSLAVG